MKTSSIHRPATFADVAWAMFLILASMSLLAGLASENSYLSLAAFIFFLLSVAFGARPPKKMVKKK